MLTVQVWASSGGASMITSVVVECIHAVLIVGASDYNIPYSYSEATQDNKEKAY